jgi:hypothetical protein
LNCFLFHFLEGKRKKGLKGKQNGECEVPTWGDIGRGRDKLIFDTSGLQEVAASYPPLIRSVSKDQQPEFYIFLSTFLN